MKKVYFDDEEKELAESFERGEWRSVKNIKQEMQKLQKAAKNTLKKDARIYTMFRLIEVRPLPGYKLYLRYADGVAGEVDLSSLVGKGVFQLWNDPEAFRRVTIGSGGELHWNDEVDICADAQYMKITGKIPEEVFPSIGKAPVHA